MTGRRIDHPRPWRLGNVVDIDGEHRAEIIDANNGHVCTITDPARDIGGVMLIAEEIIAAVNAADLRHVAVMTGEWRGRTP